MAGHAFTAAICQLALSSLALAQESEIVFDVDYGSPPHSVGQPPVLATGSPPWDGPTGPPGTGLLTPPLVVQSFGVLTDQACLIAGASGGPPRLQYVGSEFAPPRYNQVHLNLDILVGQLKGLSFEETFTIHFDLPKSHSITWRTTGEISIFAPGVSPSSVLIGSWTLGSPVELTVDIDLPALTWRIALDGREAHTGLINDESVELRKVRTILRTNSSGNAIAIDNLLLSGSDPVGPPTCTGDTGTFTINAGEPIVLKLTGTADFGDELTFFNFFLPPGASVSPPVGTTGPSPLDVTVTWTPGPSNLGAWPIPIMFTDEVGQSTICTPVIEVVSECYLLAGLSPSSLNMPDGDPLHVLPLLMDPVTLTDIPVYAIPDDPALLGLHIYFQVYMNNPQLDAADPIKMSNGLDLIVGGGSAAYGASTGMQLWVVQPAALGGSVKLGFSIDGF